mmetsp:Transcript_70521/g.146858  ORF Transcript_70521/g.146858 Transcript_70521/m.146858 type:complete len:296 (-) Transcript_70521:50-937(-)
MDLSPLRTLNLTPGVGIDLSHPAIVGWVPLTSSGGGVIVGCVLGALVRIHRHRVPLIVGMPPLYTNGLRILGRRSPEASGDQTRALILMNLLGLNDLLPLEHLHDGALLLLWDANRLLDGERTFSHEGLRDHLGHLLGDHLAHRHHLHARNHNSLLPRNHALDRHLHSAGLGHMSHTIRHVFLHLRHSLLHGDRLALRHNIAIDDGTSLLILDCSHVPGSRDTRTTDSWDISSNLGGETADRSHRRTRGKAHWWPWHRCSRVSAATVWLRHARCAVPLDRFGEPHFRVRLLLHYQ